MGICRDLSGRYTVTFFIRLSMIIDEINQHLIIPVIEKSADLIANLIFDEEQIFVTNNEIPQTITINDDVRDGDYKYVYGDRNAMQLRKFKVKEMFDICANMLKTFPELKDSINSSEAFKFVLEQYGYDNFERFKQNEIVRNDNSTSNVYSTRNVEQARMENL